MTGVGSRPLAPATQAQLAGWRAHRAQVARDAEFEAHVADAVGLLVDEHRARPAGGIDEGAVAAAFALLDAADRAAARRARWARLGRSVFSAANVFVGVVASVLVAIVLLSWWAPPAAAAEATATDASPSPLAHFLVIGIVVLGILGVAAVAALDAIERRRR